MNESYVVKKERCPKCAKFGRDLSGDNLAIYSDGHSFCFSCGFTHMVKGTSNFLEKNSEDETPQIKEQLYLPSDCDMNYPTRCLEWINKYDLSRVDLLNHNALWSESMQRLIFPVYGEGNLIAWQGRSFNLQNQAVAKIPKWYGKGNLSQVYNILGKNREVLVICEDILSAIRLSKHTCSMPIYGSYFSRERFEHLKLLGFTSVVLFLDPDKRKESLTFSKIGSLIGLNTRTIFADKDPKELSDNILIELLTIQ